MATMRLLRPCAARRFSTASTSHIHWERFTPRRGTAPDATPCLLIHGFACGADDWGSLPRAIATKSQRDVIYFDNRGVGGSAAPEGPYTVDMMASDALHVLDSAGVDQAHVLGISLGGMIAQTLALSSPDRVRALILGGTSHGGREAAPPPAEFVQLAGVWATEPEPNDSAAIDDFLSWMLPADTAEQPAGAQLKGHLKQFFVQTSRTSVGLQGQLAAMGRFNSTKRLAELARHPTLVVHGDRDAVMASANAESIHRRIPGSQLLLREGAGHFFWAHKPAEISALLADFLTACDRGPPANS